MILERMADEEKKSSDCVRELAGTLVSSRVLLLAALTMLNLAQRRVFDSQVSAMRLTLERHWKAPNSFQRGLVESLQQRDSAEATDDVPPYFAGLLAAGLLQRKELELRLPDGDPLLDLSDVADTNDILNGLLADHGGDNLPEA